MKTNILKFFGFAALLGVAQGAFATDYSVNSEGALEAALASSDSAVITLTGDFDVTEEYQIGKTVVLNLNGYTISGVAADANIFCVVSNGNLTVNAPTDGTPGGLSTGSERSCIYTAWGRYKGPKTIVINGGTFSGNCLFNYSPEAAQNAIAQRYGVPVDGAGSGGKADPTSVTINGGWFKDGYNQGNVGEYRCYYFTVNGGTFERGLDCADTKTCSIGVTTTCKAFFTGGKYKDRYPWFRWINRQGDVDVGKIFIGSATHTNVYYYENGYYVNAYDYSACEATAKVRWDVIENTTLFDYLTTQCCQKWKRVSGGRHYFRYLSEAQMVGDDVEPVLANAANNANGGAEEESVQVSQVALPTRKLMSFAAPKQLKLAAAPSSDDVCSPAVSEDALFVVGDVDDLSTYGWDVGYDGLLDVDYKETGVDYFYERTDIDAQHVFFCKNKSGFKSAIKTDQYADCGTGIEISFNKKIKEGSVVGYWCFGNDWDCLEVLKGAFGGKEADESVMIEDDDIGASFTGHMIPLSVYADDCHLPIFFALKNCDEANEINHVEATVALVHYTEGGERIVRASFTHTFGGAAEEPVPLDQKEAEVQVPAATDVVQGKTNVKIKEVDAEGNEHDVELKGDFSDPKTSVIANTMGTIDKEKSIQKAMQETQNGLKDVPVPEGENVTDSSKKLNVELKSIGIDASVAAAPVFESISYLVEPKLKTVETVGGVAQPPEERTISNEEIKASGKSIKVILPLSDDFRVSAKVRHESEDPNYPPEEFILPVLGVAGGRYVEIMTTHFSTFILSPYNAVVTESDETLGIVKVAKTAGGETVAGVPFRKFDVTSGTAKAMTVDQLLVAGFGQDDDIYAYNPAKPSGDEYDMWAWDGEKWSGVLGQAEPPAAESAEIASGKAFWFKDESDSTTPLTLAGLYQENVTTTVDVGKKSLLVNPYPVAINAAEKLKEGACVGDQFALVGGSDRYEFRDGAWGVVAKGTVIKELPGGIKIYGSDTFTAKDVIEIPAGQAFWYISTGTTAPAVAW